jgi:phosphopantothenoylcysteine decarboxylase / phosphopantothenate---cysteine ligase
MLTGKKILVGVTGSIAAYKTALLVRELIKLQAEVRVVMTPSATLFIPPLTLAVLSKNEVAVELVKEDGQQWENHVELGMWADLFIIAPLSANTLSKMATGNCDNLLISVYLSAKCPVWVAPAMDLDMFRHFSTRNNLALLEEKKIRVIEPGTGELASGLEGKGRMEEPQEIAKKILEHFTAPSKLRGKKILVTGGPTHEAIDPVRFIGNHSSGKTGILLADVLANRGAEVILVTGPTSQRVKNPYVRVIPVMSANEMMTAVEKEWAACDIGIFSAAVADYRPETTADQKIKKTGDELTLRLVKNPDILQWAGHHKKTTQFLVGFALETTNEIQNGFEKLQKKNLDLLVLNSLNDEGAGFGHDTNKISLLKPNNKIRNFEFNQKSTLMAELADEIEKELK